jgi:hypothetical protein
MINYNNKTFRSIANSESGEVNEETIFQYQQNSFLVSATYSGGGILFGHLIGLADSNGVMDIRYHHVNDEGELRTGICHTTPEVLPNGLIRLREKWKWTNGDESMGESILEEIEE